MATFLLLLVLEQDFKYFDAREVSGARDKEQRIQADLKYKF